MVKCLNIIDEFSKDARTIEAERSMSENDIVMILKALMNVHGTPEHVRMDYGTEMTGHTSAE